MDIMPFIEENIWFIVGGTLLFWMTVRGVVLSKLYSIGSINVAELKKELNSDKALLIDVRTENEFNAGRIGKATCIPLRRLVQESENLKKLGKDKKVYVICQTGNRSISGAVMLRKIGIPNVYNVKGGMVSWYRNSP